LAYIEQVLRTGEGSDVCVALAHLSMAFDDIALLPESIDSEEARFVLEHLRGFLKEETHEIVLS
jgi:hypothetical protein